MPRKRIRKKKHSVKANPHVLELTRAGSSLDLAIYADQEKIETMIIGSGSLSWKGGKRQIVKRIALIAAWALLLTVAGAAFNVARAATIETKSEAERYVLEQLQRGSIANLEEKFPKASFPDDARSLRAEFLKALFTNRDPQVKFPREIWISHAIVVNSADLRRAEIPYELSITDSIFSNAIDASDSRFAKSITLIGNIFKAGVFFNRAVIEQGLSISGCSFRDADFSRVNVGNSIMLQRCSFENKSTSFVGSRVGENFIIEECNFKARRLEFGETRVEQAFLAYGSDFTADNSNPEASNGGESDSTICFGGAHAEAFHLNQSKFRDFSFINFSRLQTNLLSVEGLEVSPQSVVLRQFMTFKQLAPMDVHSLNWLFTPYEAEFYTKVEGLFRAQGAPSEADKLFLAGKRAARRQKCRSFLFNCESRPAFLGGLFQDALAGYGKSLENLLYWSMAFLVIGTLVFRSEKGMRTVDVKDAADHAGKYNPFWYSLDLFLPIIKLGEADLWTPRDNRRWANLYKKIHIIIGSLFVPIGLAAWTGIIK